MVLREMTVAEIATPLSFTIKAYDSTYNQLYDLATLTVNALNFSLVPYTPETTYIAPMEISDSLWKVNNVGIRRNNDYDNGGTVVDSLVIGSYSAENDLIRVKVNFDTVSGVTYSIRRDSSDLKFWHSATKGGEYAFTNNECALSSDGNIWAEYTGDGNTNYTLTLVARDSTTNTELCTEEMVFRPFNSVTCAFVGENETAGAHEVSPGVNNWVVDQLLNGYDVHVWDDGYDFLYDEYGNNIIGGNMNEDCSNYGEGRAFEEVVNAINNRGVTEVALVGYSHGGGSVYNLAWRMYWDGQDPGILYSPRPDRILNPYTLAFTSYIDAVPNNYSTNGLLGDSVNDRPLGSDFHTNQYQTNSLFISGCSIPESDDNLDRSYLDVTHSNDNLALSIDTNEIVVNFLTDRFRQKVSR